MATEQTLGQRILDAADAYANAVQEAIQTWGAGEWTGHHDEATAEELATLRALAARADAAERLAVAGDREVATRDALNAALERMYADPDKGRDMDTEEEAATFEAACNEYDEALAAWRAITEEVTDG